MSLRTIAAILLALVVPLSVSRAAVPEGENSQKVALVMKALSNPFFANMEAGARTYAQDNHVSLEVFGIERESDVERQIAIVDGLISRGYGAIVLTPADSERLVPICRKAHDKGILVINIDNPLRKASLQAQGLSIPFVGSDNKAGATLVGNYVRHQLGGHGRVLVIEGIRGAENAELRKAGFTEAATNASEVTIVASESANWHDDEAFAVVSRLLSQEKGIDAIFCANDTMAMGALRALDTLDLAGKVMVCGYDNIDSARTEMRNGRMAASVEQHPELMGAYGVSLAVQGMAGKPVADYVPTPLDLVTADAFHRKIGFSLSQTHDSFFTSMATAARQAAELAGATLLTADAGDDAAQQITDVQKWVDQKVDVIIINPVNTQTISSAILLADAARIPVITVDRAADSDKPVCHVASDNVAGGRMAAVFMVQALKGKGNILELEGIAGTSASQEREKGFDEYLLDKEPVRIVRRETADFDRQKARQITSRLLEQGEKFDGVFAQNDEMILGALDAIEARHADKRPVLVGFDAIPAALEAVHQGRLDATVAQQPTEMGRMAVQAAVQYLRQETVPAKINAQLELLAR